MWRLCSICHQKFTKRSNLKRHIKSVHLGRRFNCPDCPSEFKRLEYLKKHQAKVHKDTAPEVDHSLSVPVSIPLTDFQDAVNNFDLGLLDTEDPLPGCSDTVTRTTKQPTTVQMGSQTKTCALPRRKKTKHTLIGTSPVLNRDRSTQHGPTLVDMATSPHIKWVDYQVIPINAPVSPASSTSSASSCATIYDQDHPVEEYHTLKEDAGVYYEIGYGKDQAP